MLAATDESQHEWRAAAREALRLRAELDEERARRRQVEASLAQQARAQQQALLQQQVSHVAQIHALQSEVETMRQACERLQGGQEAAEAAGLLAAREALSSKQAALQLALEYP